MTDSKPELWKALTEDQWSALRKGGYTYGLNANQQVVVAVPGGYRRGSGRTLLQAFANLGVEL